MNQQITLCRGRLIVGRAAEKKIVAIMQGLLSKGNDEYLNLERWNKKGDALITTLQAKYLTPEASEREMWKKIHADPAYLSWRTYVIYQDWCDQQFMEKYGEEEHMRQVFIHSLSSYQKEKIQASDTVTLGRIFSALGFVVQEKQEGENVVIDIGLVQPITYRRDQDIWKLIAGDIKQGYIAWVWNGASSFIEKFQEGKMVECRLGQSSSEANAFKEIFQMDHVKVINEVHIADGYCQLP